MFVQITADTTRLTADENNALYFGVYYVNSPVTADKTHFGMIIGPGALGNSGSGRTQDITPFSEFSFSNVEAREDFLLANSMIHDNYNTILTSNGVAASSYPIRDIGEQPDEIKDWLRTHDLMHGYLGEVVDVRQPNLTDVQVHDDEQFYNWLKLHRDAHKSLDGFFNLLGE